MANWQYRLVRITTQAQKFFQEDAKFNQQLFL